MNSNYHDEYYERNKKEPSGFFTDYLINILPKQDLKSYNIAELGVGNGSNLFLLKNYANQCHGYEASESACNTIKEQIKKHPQRDKFFIEEVKLPKKYNNPIKYDLVIFGFFTYLLSDKELGELRDFTLPILKGKGSYIFIYDFLTRKKIEKPDSHNQDKTIYKRNFQYWIEYFSSFDLIDFKLFDDRQDNRVIDNLNIINTNLTYDDDKWEFCALFRKK